MAKIHIERARATLRDILHSYPGGGPEHEARQGVVTLMKKMRSEGFSFADIAAAFNLGGFNIQPGDVRTATMYLAQESLWNLIQTADKLDKHCLTCPLRESIASTQADTSPTTPQLFKCLPLKLGVKPLEIRRDVPNFVYDEGLLEHPAIPGLWLTLAERTYSDYLEFVDSKGEGRDETIHELIFRTKWKKPIPMTRGSTDYRFVKMNHDLFKKK